MKNGLNDFNSKTVQNEESDNVSEQEELDNCIINSPSQSMTRSVNIKELYSPIFSQFTPEEHASVDVVWEWYSPQSKPRLIKQKRIVQEESPRVFLQKSSTNNKIVVLDKLNEELRSLTDNINNKKTEKIKEDFENIFNDSLDEEFLECSQKVEETLATCSNFCSNVQGAHDINKCESPKSHITKFQRTNNLKVRSDPILLKNNNQINNNINYKKELNTSTQNLTDDSLELVLQAFKDEDLEFTMNNKPLKDEGNADKIILLKAANTKQFKSTPRTICTEDEIEEKRKQAIQKLKMKRQSSLENQSPIKCSQDEVEKKRLQALTKRRANSDNIIEKNRLEALKRLEMSKKKRALQTKK